VKVHPIAVAALLITNAVVAAASPLALANASAVQPWSDPRDALKLAESVPVALLGSTAIDGPKARPAGGGAFGAASTHPSGEPARGAHHQAGAAPASEPRTYAMWLAWLGVVGFIGARRRSRV